jgi:hypothetical protein
MENSFEPGILKKLRVDKCSKLLIINSPENYLDLFAARQPDTVFKVGDMGKYDFVQVFGTTRTELETLLLQVKDAGKFDAVIWACYPKGGGKIKSDLKREVVWEALELVKLRAVSQVALDETWSALRGRPHELVGK